VTLLLATLLPKWLASSRHKTGPGYRPADKIRHSCKKLGRTYQIYIINIPQFSIEHHLRVSRSLRSLAN